MKDKGRVVTALVSSRRGSRRIFVTILVLLLGACVPEPEPGPEREPLGDLAPAGVVSNLNFESTETTHDAVWWDTSGGPYVTAFAEVNTPAGWTADWYEAYLCPATAFWLRGRPEVGLSSRAVDSARVLDGEQALKVFTFHRCHTAGVHQRFQVTPGKLYQVTAYAHSWYSNCSLKPHETACALDWDCESCVAVDHELYVGLDPAGGIDPYAESVVWSDPHVIYGEYSEALTVMAEATDDVMTVHLFGVAPLPLRHNDDYWDGVQVVEIERQYLPAVMKGAGA